MVEEGSAQGFCRKEDGSDVILLFSAQAKAVYKFKIGLQ
jgi:hypothetical protein